MVETFLGIQIISVSFAFWMLYVAYIHYKKGNMVKREFGFWLVVWLSMVYFALFPRVLDPILAKLFVARAMDLLMIVAFMILGYLGFVNHIGIKSLQNQIESLVRKNTISHAKKKRKKS